MLQVMKIDVDAKLLFRIGCASLSCGEYEDAIMSLQQAAKLNAKEDIAVTKKLKEAKTKHELLKKREAGKYAKMFASSSSSP